MLAGQRLTTRLCVAITASIALWPSEAIAYCVRTPSDTVACLDSIDQQPLDNRFPLILIHGWNHEAIPGLPGDDIWTNFIDYYQRDTLLRSKFKVYLFKYYSNVTDLAQLGAAFRDVVDLETQSDHKGFGTRDSVVVAHSMGGLIARQALSLPSTAGGLLGDHVLALLTLGTPHHGSMLANGPAMGEKIGSPWHFLWDDILNGLFYLAGSPDWWQLNRTDLHWDNYDDALPDFPSEYNDSLKAINSDTRYDSKIVAYAGALAVCGQCPCLTTGVYQTSYCAIDALVRNVFDGMRTDGVVPVSSALLYKTPEGPSRFNKVRLFVDKDYNHTEMAAGKEDGALFAQIKADLLAAIPRSPPTTIGGRVFDATNNRAISGATVEVLGTGLRTTTDSNGQYRLGGINAVTFTVRYSHPSYRTLDFEYTFGSGTERLDLVNGLTPAPSPYDGSWTGSGSTSSGSASGRIDIEFQVSQGIIKNFRAPWRLDVPIGYCPGTFSFPTLAQIEGQSFAWMGAESAYSYAIKGTFTSTGTVSGTVQFTRGTAPSWCPSITVNWSGRKQ